MTLPPAFTRYREDIEAELKASLLGNRFPLYRMMAYQMGWLDNSSDTTEHPSTTNRKRIRPSLCLLSCEALGKDIKMALPVAAAVELVHNFSIIHDDIQEGIQERHLKPTVWRIWGSAQAINAGDGMHALARLTLLTRSGKGMGPQKALQAVGVLDKACLRLCEGQYVDLTYQEQINLTTEDYLHMLEGKSGALMSCAAELGAITATDDEKDIRAMARFGLKLGVAFQVREDILNLWGTEHDREPITRNILNKKSLPLLYALQNASSAQKHILGVAHSKSVMDPEDCERVIGVLDSLGARELSQQKTDALCQEAVRALDEAHLHNQGKYQLLELTRFVATRNR